MGMMESIAEKENSYRRPDIPEHIVAVATSQYCQFRPQIYYQKIEPWHIVGSSLDFKMDFTTGENYAKFISDVNTEDVDSERMDQHLASTTKLVPLSMAQNDEAAIVGRLTAAASWGDHHMIGHIIRSCYVTENCALPALAASCAGGFDGCVGILLAAGLSPTSRIAPTGKNSFHIACENGQEKCAELLIEAMTNGDDAYVSLPAADGKDSDNVSAFDLMRRNDMHGMARRLEGIVISEFNRT